MIDYLNPVLNTARWVIDIEANGFFSKKPEADRIWCVCLENVGTGEEIYFDLDDMGLDGQCASMIADLKAHGHKFIGHNIIWYDAPMLNKFLGTGLTIVDLIDTQMLSQMFDPTLEGGHSLASWGTRLKFPKGDFNKFDVWDREMLKYCRNDVTLTKKVYLELQRRMNKVGYTNTGIEIEHRAWQIIHKQHLAGFHLDVEEANRLYALLKEEVRKIEEKVDEHWPPVLDVVAEYKGARKKDGERTQNYLRHKQQYVKLEDRPDGGYSAYDYVRFNVGSPLERVEKLLELGWKPREFTPRTSKGGGGNPRPTIKGQLSPSLLEFVEEGGREEVRLIARWMEANGRATMINTWLNEVGGDSRIHGSLWLAASLRYKHSQPNTANIPGIRMYEDPDKDPSRPSPEGKYAHGPYFHGDHLLGIDGAWTHEARALWAVADPVKRVLVGVDAKGIQLRNLAHHVGNAKFTEAILSEDPHTANAEAYGMPSRRVAKTVVYAIVMGAGPGRIASEAKLTMAEAKEVREMFLGRVPELGKLIERLEERQKRTGRIVLCDGTPIKVPEPRMVIPYLLQGDESRIMKKAMILAFADVRKRKLDIMKVGDIHDEWQNDALREHAEEFAFGVCPRAFAEAGHFFRYTLPIECDAKLGANWAETH